MRIEAQEAERIGHCLLEADVRESKDVSAWVEAENKVTNAYLAAIPASLRTEVATVEQS